MGATRARLAWGNLAEREAKASPYDCSPGIRHARAALAARRLLAELLAEHGPAAGRVWSALARLSPDASKTDRRKAAGEAVAGLRMTKKLAQEIADACADLPPRARQHAVGCTRVQKGVAPAGRRLPLGTPAERLEARRLARFRKNFLDTFRTPRNGCDLRIVMTEAADDIGVSCEAGTCYPYGGSYKSWKARTMDYVLRVHPRWQERVGAKGIDRFSGHMILDAEPEASDDPEIQLHRVVYAEQKRGTEVETGRGYVAVRRGQLFLRSTARGAAKAAVDGTKTAEERAFEEARATEIRLERVVRRHGDRTVPAPAAGSARGRWWDRAGLPFDVPVTLARVMEAWRWCPSDEGAEIIGGVDERLAEAA